MNPKNPLSFSLFDVSGANLFYRRFLLFLKEKYVSVLPCVNYLVNIYLVKVPCDPNLLTFDESSHSKGLEGVEKSAHAVWCNTAPSGATGHAVWCNTLPSGATRFLGRKLSTSYPQVIHKEGDLE